VSLNRNKIVSLSSDQFNAGQVQLNPFGGRGLSDVFASYLIPGRPLGEFNYVPTFAGFDDNGVMMLSDSARTGTTTDISKSDAYGAMRAGNAIAQGNPQPFLTG